MIFSKFQRLFASPSVTSTFGFLSVKLSVSKKKIFFTLILLGFFGQFLIFLKILDFDVGQLLNILNRTQLIAKALVFDQEAGYYSKMNVELVFADNTTAQFEIKSYSTKNYFEDFIIRKLHTNVTKDQKMIEDLFCKKNYSYMKQMNIDKAIKKVNLQILRNNDNKLIEQVKHACQYN